MFLSIRLLIAGVRPGIVPYRLRHAEPESESESCPNGCFRQTRRPPRPSECNTIWLPQFVSTVGALFRMLFKLRQLFAYDIAFQQGDDQFRRQTVRQELALVPAAILTEQPTTRSNGDCFIHIGLKTETSCEDKSMTVGLSSVILCVGAENWRTSYGSR